MSYRSTLQADALKLVAKKLQNSLPVEGEVVSVNSLPRTRCGGLAAYGDDGDDLMMALARRIVSGEEEDADTESYVGDCVDLDGSLPHPSVYMRLFCVYGLCRSSRFSTR